MGKFSVKELIKRRIKEFLKLGKTGKTRFNFAPFLDLSLETDILKELMFCFATPNSSAISGIRFQKLLEKVDPFSLTKEELEEMLKESGVRFYSKKAVFLSEALEFLSLKGEDFFKELLASPVKEARKRLLSFKGIGLKEASHFLRNTGRLEVAILDRHILNWLKERGIKCKTKTLTPLSYEELEANFKRLAEREGVLPGEFDLFVWYERTGKVLK